MSFMFLAGLHSELTTQRQVTPKKIKKENKPEQVTPRNPSDEVQLHPGAPHL